MQDNAISTLANTARALDAPAGSPRAQAHDVASQFEAIFVQQMVAAMRTSASNGEGGMFGSGVGTDTYSAWFDSCMADHIAQGGGVGLAAAVEKNILAHAGKEDGHA